MIMRQFIFTEAEKEPVKNMTEKEHAARWRDLKAKGDLRTYVRTYVHNPVHKCIAVDTEGRLVGAAKSFLGDIDR